MLWLTKTFFWYWVVDWGDGRKIITVTQHAHQIPYSHTRIRCYLLFFSGVWLVNNLCQQLDTDDEHMNFARIKFLSLGMTKSIKLCRSGRWHALDYKPNQFFFLLCFFATLPEQYFISIQRKTIFIQWLNVFYFRIREFFFSGNDLSKGVGHNGFRSDTMPIILKWFTKVRHKCNLQNKGFMCHNLRIKSILNVLVGCTWGACDVYAIHPHFHICYAILFLGCEIFRLLNF